MRYGTDSVTILFRKHIMIRKLIPGALAIGMAAIASAQTKEASPAADSPAEPVMKPEEVRDNSSYYFGYNTGMDFARNVSRFGIKSSDVDGQNFLKGFVDAMEGGEPQITQVQMQQAMQLLGDMLQKRERAIGETNLEKGAKFLEENGKRKGVVTTDSGLQYEVLAKGGDEVYAAPAEGEMPNKQFQVHYKGTLIDGTEFDASPAGETVTVDLQVVPGFREALTTMPVGAKWKLFLPADLGYGERRASADIGPNSVLVFELELVSIQDAPPMPQGLPFPMPQGQ